MRLFCAVLLAALLLSAAGCASRGGERGSESPSRPSQGEEGPPAQSEGENTAPQSEADSSEAPRIETLTVTVPEGYTLARIGMTLEEMGVCTVDEFIEATQTGDFSEYPLIAAQPPDENRCFRLEGYLFPDTYEIYSTDPPETLIHKMLENTERRLDGELRAAVEASGYTADEILTMASIIEKEAFGHEQMPLISSVLHNRLGIGMRLQCDVTITYVEGAIKPFITGDIDRYNGHYNTFKCDALPAGAICNPGIDAIRAALSPAETDDFFFVTDADKNYYYAETWEGHLENLEKAGIGAESE